MMALQKYSTSESKFTTEKEKKSRINICNNRVRASNGNQQWDRYGLVDRVYTKP
jgi:hypothetical protein